MECYIVNELLSRYIDGLCSAKATAAITEHLEGCADCRAVCEKMSAVIAGDIPSEQKEIDFLKKLRCKMLRNHVLVAISTCALIIGGLVVWAKNYEFTIPFDYGNTSIEVLQSAEIIQADGTTEWRPIEPLPPEAELPAEYSCLYTQLRVFSPGMDPTSTNTITRVINRDGKPVRLVYYRCARRVWNSLFGDLSSLYYDGSVWGGSYGGYGYGEADYQPMVTEVYYFSNWDSEKQWGPTEEEHDALRENGVLVWSGIA